MNTIITGVPASSVRRIFGACVLVRKNYYVNTVYCAVNTEFLIFYSFGFVQFALAVSGGNKTSFWFHDLQGNNLGILPQGFEWEYRISGPLLRFRGFGLRVWLHWNISQCIRNVATVLLRKSWRGSNTLFLVESFIVRKI